MRVILVFKGIIRDLLIIQLNKSLSILANSLLRVPVVLLVSQVSLVFQEILEEKARQDHVVLLVRRESPEKEEMIT